MGFVYLFAVVLFSSILGVTYKLTDRYKCDRSSVNFFLFFTALLAAAVYFVFSHNQQISLFAAILAVGVGLVGFVNITVFRIAVSKGNISTSWTIINLSMVIPVVVSIIFWHEIPTVKHALGALLVIAAILLIGKDIRSNEQ